MIKKTVLEGNKCFELDFIPKKNQTIFKSIPNLLDYFDHVHHVYLFRRDASRCPNNKGNWLIDIEICDNEYLSILLPLQMTRKQINDFISPLIKNFVPEHEKIDIH